MQLHLPLAKLKQRSGIEPDEDDYPYLGQLPALGFGPSLRFDTRDDVMWPEAGWLFKASAVPYLSQKIGMTVQADARRYCRFPNPRFTAAFRLMAWSAHGALAAPLVPCLDARALHPRALRGRAGAQGGAELTAEIAGPLMAAAFAEPCFLFQPHSLAFVSYGAGLRLRLYREPRLRMRVDIAWAGFEPAFSAGLASAF